MNNCRGNRLSTPPQGVAAILGLFLVLVFIPLVVLTVDLGNVFRVKTELQVAAESAALSGARSLYFNGQGPDWPTAEAQATEIGRLYYAQGASIRDVEVVTGYWHPSNPQEIKPPYGGGITFDDYPAVSVTLHKAPGKNQGPFVPAFGGVIGLAPVPLSAKAVAVVSGVGRVEKNTLFPFVMSRCLFTYFWNATGDPPGPAIDPATGAPYIFQLGDGFVTPPCGTSLAFWTSYKSTDNSASGISELLETQNQGSLQLGDDIWLSRGNMNRLYGDVSNLLKTCPGSLSPVCDDVIVAVIDDPKTGENLPIEAFACIRILSADRGSRPNVRVQMTTTCDTTGTGGLGPPLIVGPPKLVQ